MWTKNGAVVCVLLGLVYGGSAAPTPEELELAEVARRSDDAGVIVVPPVLEEKVGETDHHSAPDPDTADQDKEGGEREVRQTDATYEVYPGTARVTLFNPDGTTFTRTVQQLSIKAHNMYRSRHKSTPGFSWNETMAIAAADYARTVVDIETEIPHSDTEAGGYGENLFAGITTYDAIFVPGHAVRDWYREMFEPVAYNFLTAQFSASTGHFTQMIWKGSGTIGCGMATKRWVYGPVWKRTIVVCRYMGFGNNDGGFIDNVKQLKTGQGYEDPYTLNDLINNIPQGCADYTSVTTCQAYQSQYCDVVRDSCPCECP